jgi:hypothetical protein
LTGPPFTSFRRGFPWHVESKGIDPFLAQAESLFEAAPLQALTVNATEQSREPIDLTGLFESPHLEKLKQLSFTLAQLTADTIRQMQSCPYLRNLTTVATSCAGFLMGASKALFQPPLIEQLESVQLESSFVNWSPLAAAELLAAPDVGIVPWVVLAHHEGTPEGLLQRCRERIDREGGQQRANLLAVTQVFTRLRFDRPEYLDILGGRNVMQESPLILELQEEACRKREVQVTRKHLLRVLRARFKEQLAEVAEVEKRLQDATKPDVLERLFEQALNCGTLMAFDESVRQELAPPPASTRGKRRSGKPSA